MARRIILPALVVLLILAGYFWFTQNQQEAGIFAQIVSTPESIAGFARAQQPGHLNFPADFGPHPEYQTEWWYYTGNLETEDGRHFGYELTFFRRGLLPADQSLPRFSDWATNQIYMAHFALTDVEGNDFYAFERFSRGSAGLAGAQADPYEVWLEDWRVRQTGDGPYLLEANSEGLSLELQLRDEKGPILHGIQGYSQKGPDPGNASYYYSQTRLGTEGTVAINGEIFSVSGLSWKDHEYSTAVLSPEQVGWDWFSIQLEDGYELMLYQIRQADGSVDPFSSGTLIAPDGTTEALAREDFEITPQGIWRSPHSGADYPMGWSINIPSANLELTLEAYSEDQELNLTFIYWEGAVRVSGMHNGLTVLGTGYTEMTGYAEPFDGSF